MRWIRAIISVLFILVLCSTAAAQAGLTVKLGDVLAGHRQVTDVPIEVAGASNVGSLHIELVYDPAVLDPLEVKTGALASGAMLEKNMDTPGRVVIGLISAQGISGEGQVAVVSFDVPGQQGDTSPLSLENVQAHDATSLSTIQTTVESGTFRVGAAGGADSTTLILGIFAVILVAAVLIIWQVTRGRRLAPAAGPAIHAGQLSVARGQASRASVSLDRPVITIGRDPASDLVLEDDLVSRQHAQIRQEPEGPVIHDLNSTNGTFVNGERIDRPHPLRPGDIISMGDMELVFRG